jgi:hypothetical protein
MKDLSTRTALIIYGIVLIIAVVGWFNITVIKVSGVLLMIFAIGLTVFGND